MNPTLGTPRGTTVQYGKQRGELVHTFSTPFGIRCLVNVFVADPRGRGYWMQPVVPAEELTVVEAVSV